MRTTGYVFMLAVWALGFSTPVFSQPLSYSLLSASSATQPSPRFDGTIAYDPLGRQVFLFGGQDTQPRNDLWAFSLASRQWTEIQVLGARPAARFGHTLIFDPQRRRLVLFGGQAGGFFSDVWAYDVASGGWQQLAADDAGPSRRYAHSAIYEPVRDRLVISHGFTNAGRFDDTWAFDFSNNSWRNLSPSGTRPLRRCLHHAAYDAANGQMYLYGGCASGFGPCPLGDLWSFDLNTNQWTERTGAVKPPAREHYGMAFDAVRGRLVLFGGNGGGLLNDTWEFDPRAGSWQQTALSGPAPSPRHRHEAAYVTDRGFTVFFGGIASSGLTNELWMLGPSFVLGRPEVSAGGVVNAFSGEGGAVAPGEAVSIYGRDLGPINGIALGFDPITGLLPTSGPGVSVTWNGIPAPLYFVLADQLNVQVPYELDGATEARLVVTVNGQASDPVTVPVSPTRPGLAAQVWNQDASLNSPGNPAPVGSIIVLYATGQGVTRPPSRTGAFPAGGVYPESAAATSLTIGGIAAEILFQGQAPATTGLMQINARVQAESLPAPRFPCFCRLARVRARGG